MMMMMRMEREVTDSEGVFSRRLSSNWAELPQTLRKKQKHRPEILSQFTDMSESECEYRPASSKRVVKRSEFLRKLENRNLLQLQQQQQQYRRSVPDYRLRYEAQDMRRRSLANLDNLDLRYTAKLSDDERKTNSPDSLLVRSSESESSVSDEYGHTDDSGAFLEKFEKSSKDAVPLRHRFAKFFTKTDNSLDVNKNNVSKQQHQPKKKESFEYENIPRIDIGKIEPKRASNQPTTLEQLRLEEGCQLRNRKNSFASSVERPKSTEELIRDYYNGSEDGKKMETIREEKNNPDASKLSVREILKRFEQMRSENEAPQLIAEQDKSSTLTTIQETLQKLDEKVKSYQVNCVRASHLLERERERERIPSTFAPFHRVSSGGCPSFTRMFMSS